jgi:apolipoprotein D and lipocalin family protein
MKQALIVFTVMILSACVGIPDHIDPVNGFDSMKYLGTWYEIARLDHAFERNMTRVSATYTLREDGGIDVLNRGYSIPDK